MIQGEPREQRQRERLFPLPVSHWSMNLPPSQPTPSALQDPQHADRPLLLHEQFPETDLFPFCMCPCLCVHTRMFVGFVPLGVLMLTAQKKN